MAGGSRRALCAAFSLIEIMVVVVLLSVIILGLMAMFTQTQRAFRLGMAQTDVLESGRMATEMIVREVEQVTPSYQNTNFFAEVVNFGDQILPANIAGRTNVLEDVYFLTRENQNWNGIGYFVRTNSGIAGSYGRIGTLYRYETNSPVARFRSNPFSLWAGYNAARNGGSQVNVSRILDGVVLFRMRTYNANGEWITAPMGGGGNPYGGGGPATTSYWRNYTNIIANTPYDGVAEAALCSFYSNAVPAFVELEVGVLEPQPYEHYRSIPLDTAQAEFLQKQASHVHLFRQRIAIRNVDPSAYQ